MYNHIILSSCLFGSVYLFSKSLTLTNRALLKNKKILNELIIVNGLTMLGSGFAIVYSFSLLHSCHCNLIN
jgi:predicted alpha/beta superfamily hydrolase